MAMAASGSAKVTLPSDTEILITREFAAPPRLVYKAWTEPELVRRWWAGHRGQMKVAEIDLRVGGTWRYVMEAQGGFDVAFHGEYREIVPGERIVTTEVFEGAPPSDAGDVVNVVTFEEAGGGTHLGLLVQCPSREIRDMIHGSGMEGGLQEQMELLDALTAELPTG
jgi:uncharacterized protein YndB with AHSA1/START domain